MCRTKFDDRSRVRLLVWCSTWIALLGSPPTGFAQDEEEDDAAEEDAPAARTKPEAAPAAEAPKFALPKALPPGIPSVPPSPFTLVVKGLVSGSMFVQNVPAVGNGSALLFGPYKVARDGWGFGGDVRQTRLTFTIRGPEVLAGAIPTGVVEMDLGGYNYQVTPVGGLSAVLGQQSIDPMTGRVVTTPVAIPYNTITNESRFDENIVPRMRLAYIELNWNQSQDILRVGQYHNLLLFMIPSSASHLASPLGYGAGELGWRSPGVTYLHRFKVSPDFNLDFGVQINRNSWRDELPPCPSAPPNAPGGGYPLQTQSPAANCLPNNVSFGEASLLPQVQARIDAFGGLATNPLPMYIPTLWAAYISGTWDIKDLTGAGNATLPTSPPPPGRVYRDTMTTYAVQGGAKIQLGPLLIAANGWYGQNAGNVFGHIFQMQDPSGPDVSGFGAWGQIGLGLGTHFSLWAFMGIDKPNEAQAIAAGSSFQVAGVTRLQNIQAAAQLLYTDGPIQIGLEYLHVATTSLYPAIAPNPVTMAPGAPAMKGTYTGSQPSVTMNYNF